MECKYIGYIKIMVDSEWKVSLGCNLVAQGFLTIPTDEITCLLMSIKSPQGSGTIQLGLRTRGAAELQTKW